MLLLNLFCCAPPTVRRYHKLQKGSKFSKHGYIIPVQGTDFLGVSKYCVGAGGGLCIFSRTVDLSGVEFPWGGDFSRSV